MPVSPYMASPLVLGSAQVSAPVPMPPATPPQLANPQNPFLQLYQTQLPTGATWYFTHRPNSKGGVAAIPVIYRPDQEPTIRLEVNRRVPMGGKLTLELPGGSWGDKDPNEDATTALKREIGEELGFQSVIHWPNNVLYAVEPGSTTEHGAIGIAAIDGRQLPQKLWEPDEFYTLAGEINVPVSTFLDYNRFQQWLSQCQAQGLEVSRGILDARALMPPDIMNAQKYLSPGMSLSA